MNILKKLVHPHKLLALAKVVEHKNITYASKDLHMTQPAVTNIIRQLEKHFGQTLVRAEGKQLMITDAAHLLVKYWKHLENTYEDMHQAMHAHEQGDVGLIRLHMVSTGKYLMPKVMTTFQASYPKVIFSCHITHREFMLEAIKNHEADLALITNPPHDDKISAIKLTNNPLAFVVNQDHPLAQKSKISLKELSSEYFIIREKSALITQYLFEIFSKQEITPNIAYEIDSTEAIKESLLAGNNIALLPLSCVQREASQKLLTTLNMTQQLKQQLNQQYWYIIKSKHYPLNAISEKFVTEIMKHFN